MPTAASVDNGPPPTLEVARYLASAAALPPPWQPPLADRRKEQSDAVLRNSGPLQDVSETEEIDACGVRARVYRPHKNERAALVWLHGGGWVFHDIDTYDPLARAIAATSNAAVVSVEYRRPPEQRFPAAVDDASAALRWALGQYARVAIGGDSAGANLAAAAALSARDDGLDVALQVLVYPMLDYRVDTDSYRRHVENYTDFAGVDNYGAAYRDAIKWMWDQYLPSPLDRANPKAAPLRAESLAGAAPAFIITAEHDILRPEAEEYAGRLDSEGLLVELYEFKGQVHGFLDALGVLHDARRAIHMMAGRLRESFCS